MHTRTQCANCRMKSFYLLLYLFIVTWATFFSICLSKCVARSKHRESTLPVSSSFCDDISACVCDKFTVLSFGYSVWIFSAVGVATSKHRESSLAFPVPSSSAINRPLSTPFFCFYTLSWSVPLYMQGCHR
eukprot:GHVR01071928.1.p1 GENE.GHVR01071928.1~~GHVR01071928.1.p1  ORF type:complete len:131 (-),score=11.69 GHVR01071928.1:697-1089(-)